MWKQRTVFADLDFLSYWIILQYAAYVPLMHHNLSRQQHFGIPQIPDTFTMYLCITLLLVIPKFAVSPQHSSGTMTTARAAELVLVFVMLTNTSCLGTNWTTVPCTYWTQFVHYIMYKKTLFLAEEVPVATFQEDGHFSDQTFMRSLQNFSNDLVNFTQCLRLRLFHLRGFKNVLWNYANEDDMDMLKLGKGQANNAPNLARKRCYPHFQSLCTSLTHWPWSPVAPSPSAENATRSIWRESSSFGGGTTSARPTRPG